MENQKQPTNLFDKFIDQFSVRELRTRIWFVIIIGFALCGLAIGLGWLLLTHDFFVADEPGLRSIEFINLLLKGKPTP